jgi:hypothetical protein
MKQKFRNFYVLLSADAEQLGTFIEKENTNNIEFGMPIKTFGKVFGHNYIGIEKNGYSYEMYIITKSPLRKIKGKRKIVSQNMEIEYYEEIMNELIMSQMMIPKYQKIASGRIF